jgi:hypothetical protein
MVKKDHKENLTEQSNKSQSAQDHKIKSKGSSNISLGKEEKHRQELNKKLLESGLKIAELQDKY